MDGTAIPLGLDTPLAVIGYLHGVGRRLADADAQDRSTLLGDASCPGEMDEGRENERGAIREAHLTGQQQAALQRLHLREELPRRARALKRWLVAHGDAPREKGSRGNPLDVRAEDGPDTAPHIRTSTWREFNWKASSDSQIPWRRAPARPVGRLPSQLCLRTAKWRSFLARVIAGEYIKVLVRRRLPELRAADGEVLPPARSQSLAHFALLFRSSLVC